MRGKDYFSQITSTPPMSRLHPRIGEFFKDYLAGEKAVCFMDKQVVNTHFPPYPSRAFTGLVDQLLGPADCRQLYSVTLAVTNRCNFNCWHCYNAGRNQRDMSLEVIRGLAGKLQEQGAVMINLTGGEPLLRPDLEEICASFDDRSCVIVGTTGWGLTSARARSLRASGVFGMGISLDSADESEHDRLRGRKGAFRAATQALAIATEAYLYPYIVSVATREFLEHDRFDAFMTLARNLGALEVHLLEPCPTGNLTGRKDVILTATERQQIVKYQHEVAKRDDLPILSTFTYLEGSENFGCGAGLTHLYIDGSGELCPCNLVPLSFGNITLEPLEIALDRMRQYFRQPRSTCVGRTLNCHIKADVLPAAPDLSCAICEQHLPQKHALPKFFQIRTQAHAVAGIAELEEAYNHVSANYDDFWTVKAGVPVRELIQRLDWHDAEKVFEAGCGSGFATVLLADKLNQGGILTAVDISEGMQLIARRRLQSHAPRNVEFKCGDALLALQSACDLDIIFSSWVLGYIPVPPFLTAASQALKSGGQLAFIVHRENSPRREFGLFAELVGHDPSILLKQVAFDFPRDAHHVRETLETAGLKPVDVWEDRCVFHYATAEQVLEHLLKSGAGTVFYEAVDPGRRDSLTQEFLGMLRERRDSETGFDVCHDYVACIARKN